MSWETGIAITVFGVSFVVFWMMNFLDEEDKPIKLLYHSILLFVIYAGFAFAIYVIQAQGLSTTIEQNLVNIVSTIMFAFGLVIYVVFGYVLIITIKAVLDTRRESRGKLNEERFG